MDIDLFRINFPLDRVWFMHRIDYWVTDLNFEVLERHTHCDPTARVLVGWHKVELFSSRPQDRAALYVRPDSFDWPSYWSHRLLGVLMPPVLAYYGNSVLLPIGAQRHLTQAIALTEFTVCSVLRFLLASRNGILSRHRLCKSPLLKFLVFFPVSSAGQQPVDELNFLEIVHDLKIDAVAAVMAWRTFVELNWDELARLDVIPHVYFDAEWLAGFLPNGSGPYLEDLCPNRFIVEREVAKYYRAQESSMGTVVVNPVQLGQDLRSVPSASIAVSSARVIASSGLASAVVTVHPSSSQSGQVSKVSTTVAVASTVSLGHPLPSCVVEHASVPPLLTPGDTVFEDLRGPSDLVGEQRKAAARLGDSRRADLESVRNDLVVATVTVSERSLTLEYHRSETAQLQGEVIRLKSEDGAFEMLRAERKVSRRRLADRDTGIDRLRAVLTSACNAIDDGFEGPDDKAKLPPIDLR